MLGAGVPSPLIPRLGQLSKSQRYQEPSPGTVVGQHNGVPTSQTEHESKFSGTTDSFRTRAPVQQDRITRKGVTEELSNSYSVSPTQYEQQHPKGRVVSAVSPHVHALQNNSVTYSTKKSASSARVLTVQTSPSPQRSSSTNHQSPKEASSRAVQAASMAQSIAKQSLSQYPSAVRESPDPALSTQQQLQYHESPSHSPMRLQLLRTMQQRVAEEAQHHFENLPAFSPSPSPEQQHGLVQPTVTAHDTNPWTPSAMKTPASTHVTSALSRSPPSKVSHVQSSKSTPPSRARVSMIKETQSPFQPSIVRQRYRAIREQVKEARTGTVKAPHSSVNDQISDLNFPESQSRIVMEYRQKSQEVNAATSAAVAAARGAASNSRVF